MAAADEVLSTALVTAAINRTNASPTATLELDNVVEALWGACDDEIEGCDRSVRRKPSASEDEC